MWQPGVLTRYSLGSFMMSMLPGDTFGGFTFAAFSTKNIPVVAALMISLSLIEHLIVAFFNLNFNVKNMNLRSKS